MKVKNWREIWNINHISHQIYVKRGVPVSFSKGCLYTLPLQSQMIAKECVQCVHWLAVGNIFIFFLLFLPDISILKRRFNKHVCEADNCSTLLHMQQENIVEGNLCQTPAVQWMSVVRSGEIFWKEKKKCKNAPIVFIFQSTMHNSLTKPLWNFQ